MLFPPHILLPGPTPVPYAVQQAMLTPLSDHRGAVFQEVARRVPERIKQLLHMDPNGKVAVMPTSGTGVLEAAIQNFFMPGDTVLSVETGAFGERFKTVAEHQGVTVQAITYPWGQAFSPAEVLDYLDQHPVKGVLVTHNETSTGVLNPVETLGQQLKDRASRPLLIVDSISGVPSVPMNMQDWAVDVLVAASQKGFMCPPGLGILAVSGYAEQHLLPERPGRYYLDARPYLNGNFPYTPAVSLWYGLDQALALLAEEGETTRFERHRLLSRITRAYARAGGLHLLVEDQHASPTVTALGLPDAITPADVKSRAARLGLQVAGGMGPWHDRAIRIGHVGLVDAADLWAGLGVLAHVLPDGPSALEKGFAEWHEFLTTKGLD